VWQPCELLYTCYLLVTYLLNRPPDRTWRRPPGHPRNKWLDQLQNNSTCPIGDLWGHAVDMVVQRRDSPRQLLCHSDHDDDDDICPQVCVRNIVIVYLLMTG